MKKMPIILVIDDDEQICYTFNELFQFQGWSGIAAKCVEDGLKKFEEFHPDLVLIDYHMPNINGVDGVRMLRNRSKTVPIIVFTIDESQAVADAFLDAGASDFALKPIKAPDILSRIKLHLQLLEHKHTAPAQLPVLAKGIGRCTLALIEEQLMNATEAMTVNDLTEGTGLAYQTVYRYLQHLTQEEKVTMVNIYGKIGRPKQIYRWNDEKMKRKKEKK